MRKPARHGKKNRLIILRYAAYALTILVIWIVIAIGDLRTFLWNMPSLSGYPGSHRDYLIIFQNNYELRPTGGFISAYGILKFRHGLFAGIEIQDTFGKIDDHPYIEPPKPMKELLAHEFYQGYTFRDANWDPDFPKTAQELENFLHINFPDQKIDGVIAVDFTVLEDLIGVFGKIKVEGSTFTENSVFELVEHSVSNIDRHNVGEIENRKDILKEVARKLIWRTLLRPLKLDDIAAVLAKNLDEKHILLYFKNPNLEKKIAGRGWNGIFGTSTNGPVDGVDYIALVEANLGGMKSNRYIARDITYEVNLETRKAELGIAYRHFGELAVPLSGNYQGYLRTYVSGNIFEKTLKIPHGEQLEFSYAYPLPDETFDPAGGRYVLKLRKQPGTQGDRYRVIVRAPLGHSVMAGARCYPEPAEGCAAKSGQSGWNIRRLENYAFIEGALTRDATLTFDILPDILPPRPAYHEITALNKIELHFNEDISRSAVEDFLNFQVTDTDKSDLHTDTVIIKNIIHNGRFLTFETEGMTIQPEEFYALEIKNIRDTSGNLLAPSPRTLTLVQRLR